MTNLLNKTIEGLYAGELNSVQKDVLTWLEGTEAETLDDAVNTLQNVSCESGDVSHLIYNVDCGLWIWEHSDAIEHYLNCVYGVEIDLLLPHIDSHDELSDVISYWHTGDYRLTQWLEDNTDKAEEACIENIEDWEELDEGEQQDCINEELDHMQDYVNPFELDKHDKTALSWFIFEAVARDLAEQLEGIREVIAGE